MRILIVLAALLLPSVCMAQQGPFGYTGVQILGAGHPSSPQYGRGYYYRPYRYYGHVPYRGGYRPYGGGILDVQKMQQTWALRDIADALQQSQSNVWIYDK